MEIKPTSFINPPFGRYLEGVAVDGANDPAQAEAGGIHDRPFEQQAKDPAHRLARDHRQPPRCESDKKVNTLSRF
ncbi:MAG: hypothetical protein WCB44_20135 [Stellaceae bacterium]